MTIRTISLADWNAACLGQGVPRLHVALKCCVCGTVQSMADLVAAGMSEDDAARRLGTDCVGRFTGASAHLRGDPPGRGCDWTLGGLFKAHTLEVVDGEQRFATFEPATPEEAQAHMRGEPQKFTPLTEEHLHVLQHSIGADEHGRIVRGGGRNHFVTGDGSKDHLLCVALVEYGLMTRRPGSAISGGDDIFHVTAAGRLYVERRSPPPPKLTRGQQRYQQFLDEDCGYSFGEWLQAIGRQRRSHA